MEDDFQAILADVEEKGSRSRRVPMRGLCGDDAHLMRAVARLLRTLIKKSCGIFLRTALNLRKRTRSIQELPSPDKSTAVAARPPSGEM
jgi:hypothetical protein